MFLSKFNELFKILQPGGLETLVRGGYEIVNCDFVFAQEGVQVRFVEEAGALSLWGDEPEEEAGAEPGVEGDPVDYKLVCIIRLRSISI